VTYERWHTTTYIGVASNGALQFSQLKEMKVTENNNYGQYIKAGLVDFFSRTPNYIYLGLIILAFGLFWTKDGLGTTLRLFSIMTNGFIVTFLLTEILMTLMYKEFKRNRYITYIWTIGILTTINIIYLDNKALYWSFVTGLIFLVPVVVGLAFNKIKFWGR